MVLRILALLLLVFMMGTAVFIVLAGSPTGALIFAVNHTIGQPVAAGAPPVHVEVRPGENASTLADELEANHVIRSSLAFRTIVRLRGLGGSIETGEYRLDPNSDVSTIASSFDTGHLVGGQITIPEGWRALQIADALDRAGISSRADFLAAVARPNLGSASTIAPAPGHSLEGYLYPDTYRFNTHSNPTEVTRRLVENFARHLSPELTDGFSANQLDLNAALTLASIVEREAVVPSERATIASVYLNRLHRGMRLQADPTVQFALVTGDGAGQSAAGYWKHPLTFTDLALSSPYNTYQMTGLPPGPICSPGAASLAAVAHPATTDFLYFVARPDGSHAFARTLEEHQKNIAAFQPAGAGQ
jgi:UPF0755 protein